jgi:hypothetical protein
MMSIGGCAIIFYFFLKKNKPHSSGLVRLEKSVGACFHTHIVADSAWSYVWRVEKNFCTTP